jgi:hypothetical protein
VGAVAAGVAGNPRLTAPDAPALASAAPAQQTEIPIASNSRLTGIKGYYPDRGQVRKKLRIGKAVTAVSEEPRDGAPPNGRPPAPSQAGPREPGLLSLSTRRRAYFALMGVCLVLIVLSWTLIWRFSILAAVIMSAVALFIPPLAAIVANAGPANRQ